MSRHRKVKALDYDEEYDDYYGYDDYMDEDENELDFEAKYLSTGIDLSAPGKSNNISGSNINKQTIVDEGNSIIKGENDDNVLVKREAIPACHHDNDDNESARIHLTSADERLEDHPTSRSSIELRDEGISSTKTKEQTHIDGDDEYQQQQQQTLTDTITSDLTRIAIQHLDKHQWQLPLMEMDRKFRDRTYYKHYTDTYITSLRSKLGNFLADNQLKSNPMRYHIQQELDNYRKYSQMFDLLTEYYQSLGSGFFSFATPSPDEQIVIGCRLGTKVKKPVPKESALAKDEQSTARFEYNGRPQPATSSGQQQRQQPRVGGQQKPGDKQTKGKQQQHQQPQTGVPKGSDLTVRESFTADQLSRLSQEYNESLRLKDKKASDKHQQQPFSANTSKSTKAKQQPQQTSTSQKLATKKSSSSNEATTSSGPAASRPQLVTLVEKRQQMKQQQRQQQKAKKANNIHHQVSEKDLEMFKVRALQAAKEYEEFVASCGRPRLNLVVVGHVDAGKSTLVGHLLFKLGQISNKQMHRFETDSQRSGKASFKFAWAMDETEEERARGVTIDIALTKFETAQKDVVLLDAPGHVDFIPAVISGAAQADAALLVVDATRGEFETGFSAGGQTREHTFLVRSLGVKSLIVVVNKMDNVDWSPERFYDIVDQLRPFLKQVGFKLQGNDDDHQDNTSEVQFVAASGLTGENLVERRGDKRSKQSSHPQLERAIGGCCLVEAIDRMQQPARMVDKPTRVCVTDVYKGMSSGVFLGAKLISGKLEPKQRLLLLPPGEMCEIKMVEVRDSATTSGGSSGGRLNRAFAGDIVTTVATGVDLNKYYRGCLLCDPLLPCHVTNRFQARIVMFQSAATILMKGTPVEVHLNGTYECGEVRRLISLLNKNTGELIQMRPRCLGQNSSAIVQLRLDRVVCCDLYEDNKTLGRFMLRSCGKTIAAGLITKIKSAKLIKSGTKMRRK